MRPIAAGDLKDFVAVERKAPGSRSAVGQVVVAWEIVEERSCRIEAFSARTALVAQAAQSRDTAEILFRWPLDDVKPLDWRFRDLDTGRVWNVTSVDRSPDREFVKVRVSEAASTPIAAGGA